MERIGLVEQFRCGLTIVWIDRDHCWWPGDSRWPFDVTDHLYRPDHAGNRNLVDLPVERGIEALDGGFEAVVEHTPGRRARAEHGCHNQPGRGADRLEWIGQAGLDNMRSLPWPVPSRCFQSIAARRSGQVSVAETSIDTSV